MIAPVPVHCFLLLIFIIDGLLSFFFIGAVISHLSFLGTRTSVIWAVSTVASVLYMSYIAFPANFGRLDPAHHVFRMTVNRDFGFKYNFTLASVHFQHMMG